MVANMSFCYNCQVHALKGRLKRGCLLELNVTHTSNIETVLTKEGLESVDIKDKA